MLKKVLKKIISLTLFFSLSASGEKVVLDKIAVIVGDGLVLESQFNLKFQKYVQEFSKQNPGQALPPESFLKKQILESLIVEELLLQKAERFGVRISDQELNESLVRYAERTVLVCRN